MGERIENIDYAADDIGKVGEVKFFLFQNEGPPRKAGVQLVY